jgi:predicted chitinase/LysM repeat protein
MAIQVRPGDTLSGIAARHGTTVSALMKANPQIKNANLIYAGQKINLPGASDGFQPAPAASGGKYVVKAGDTLSAIGARFGVSYQQIAAANGISNPNRIYVGQQLTIPGAKSSSSSSSSSAVSAASTPAPVGNTKGGVTVAQLRAIMPNLSQSRAEQLLPHLNKAMIEGGINTPKRQAAFLAQLAHESVGLTAFEEYASGAAYEGRKDLGNIYPGDGVRYKGRGPIQLTGRANYRAAGKALGIDLEGNPKRAADPDVGFRIAVWFWNSRNLSASADAGNFDYITYRINGGQNGKASRHTYWERAKSVLGA